MAERKQYTRTLFLAGLFGQYKIWKNSIVQELQSSDKIIQLGNFIGCNDFAKDNEQLGPNEAITKFLFLFKSTADKWEQLAGDQEIAALNYPDEWTNNSTRQILRNAWFHEDPKMKTAIVHNKRLITHGGMTYGEWVNIGKPKTPEEAAKLLNEKYKHTLYQGPSYKLGSPPNYSANPIWCDPLMEYYPSWITAPVPMPFDQIHSDNSINTEDGRAMLADKTNPIHYIDQTLYRKFGSISYINGMQTTAIHIPLPGKIIKKIPDVYSIYVEKMVINTKPKNT